MGTLGVDMGTWRLGENKDMGRQGQRWGHGGGDENLGVGPEGGTPAEHGGRGRW